MRHEDEIKRGIEYLRGVVEGGKVLRLSEPQVLGQFNFWYLFTVTGYSKQWLFTLSRDEVSDIPGTRRYQQSALAFAKALEQRFKNISPSLFSCLSGRLIEINVEWPHVPWPGRRASYVKVRVTDKMTDEVASCFVTQTTAQDMFELKEDPFQEYSGIVNSIREAINPDSIAFYSAEQHPDELQQVKLTLGPRKPREAEMSRFLKQKVFSMGFWSGDGDTQVWIADPWDAEYLGVAVKSLRQEAEFLAAEDFVKLDEDKDFASAEKKLLLEERSRKIANEARPTETPTPVPAPERVDDGRPTVFISYSYDSEEHKEWVLTFAERLQAEGGVNVILDRWHLRKGGEKAHFMETSILHSDFVLIICTPEYARKSNDRVGGVGYETVIIVSEVSQNILQAKFIPVLRIGDWKTALPTSLQSRIGADLRDNPYREDEYQDLLRELHGAHLKPPPLGPKPAFPERTHPTPRTPEAQRLVPRMDADTSPAQASTPKPNAIAYAIYETKGPGAKRLEAYVRPADSNGTHFILETSDGEKSEKGSAAEISRDFILLHLDLLGRGYVCMNYSDSSALQQFKLPT